MLAAAGETSVAVMVLLEIRAEVNSGKFCKRLAPVSRLNGLGVGPVGPRSIPSRPLEWIRFERIPIWTAGFRGISGVDGSSGMRTPVPLLNAMRFPSITFDTELFSTNIPSWLLPKGRE